MMVFTAKKVPRLFEAFMKVKIFRIRRIFRRLTLLMNLIIFVISKSFFFNCNFNKIFVGFVVKYDMENVLVSYSRII